MAEPWYQALCIIADHEPFAFWHLTYGAAFWWTPDRAELGPEGFTKQPFTYAEIDSIVVFDKVRIGKEVLACDWLSLRSQLLRLPGLTFEELRDYACGPSRPPNQALQLRRVEV